MISNEGHHPLGHLYLCAELEVNKYKFAGAVAKVALKKIKHQPSCSTQHKNWGHVYPLPKMLTQTEGSILREGLGEATLLNFLL